MELWVYFYENLPSLKIGPFTKFYAIKILEPLSQDVDHKMVDFLLLVTGIGTVI